MGVAGGVSCTRRVLYSGCGWGCELHQEGII